MNMDNNNDIDQVLAGAGHGNHQLPQEQEDDNTDAQVHPATHYNHFLGDGTTHVPQDRLHMLDFILAPIPQFLKMQCRIFRYRDGISKLSPGYEAFLEDGHQQIFLMAARKLNLVTGQPSVYVIYDSPLSETQHALPVARIKSNFLGTAFSITSALPADDGADPVTHEGTPINSSSWWQTGSNKNSAPPKRDNKKWNEELAAVLYEPNILGFKGPRKMTILLPLMTPKSGERIRIIPKNESETLLERMKSDNDPLIIKLNNKNPQWNEETHSYVLNFNGRVTVASVKNFQVVHAHDLDYIVMQFGRADEGAFSMDAQYPLSPIQAFGICLSSFDAKLACE